MPRVAEVEDGQLATEVNDIHGIAVPRLVARELMIAEVDHVRHLEARHGTGNISGIDDDQVLNLLMNPQDLVDVDSQIDKRRDMTHNLYFKIIA